MRNDEFRKLVSLLEGDAGLLHNFIMEGASDPRLSGLLSGQYKAFASSASKDAKLANVLLSADLEKAKRAAAVAACVDSCEASRAGAFAGPWHGWHGADCDSSCPMTGCSCSNGSTCTTTCTATCAASNEFEIAERYQNAARLAGQRAPGNLAAGFMAGVSCDANTTCSCTSGTCGGPTCGGSTCDATCTGDSCGSTCGDSCGWTSNLTRDLGQVTTPWQLSQWR